MSPDGDTRAFSVGRVAPAGWQLTRGSRPSLLGTMAPLPASAGVARWKCAEFAESVGATRAITEAVMVAVSEAVTNIVLYAYPRGRTGMAHVAARISAPGRLTIVVSDDGVGLEDAPGMSGDEHGLAIIEKLTAEFDVVSEPGKGTRIEMTFELASAA